MVTKNTDIGLNVRRKLFVKFTPGGVHQVESVQPNESCRKTGAYDLIDLNLVDGASGPAQDFTAKLKLGDGPWISAQDKDVPKYNGYSIVRRVLRLAKENPDKHVYAQFVE